jgi:hypothetical protein
LPDGNSPDPNLRIDLDMLNPGVMPQVGSRMVPEPESFMLLAIGLICPGSIVLLVRHRHKAALQCRFNVDSNV